MKAETTEYTLITLTMSEVEAQFLADVMSCIGGPAAYTRRVHADEITKALQTVGVESPLEIKDLDRSTGGAGSIYFK